MNRILFLTLVLPFPLDSGPKIRAYYVLRYLAERHTITLLSFTRNDDPTTALEHLQSICEQVVTVPIERSRVQDVLAMGRSLLTGEPILTSRNRIHAMSRDLAQLITSCRDPFDAIHADQLWMAPYALEAARLCKKRGWFPRLVLDQHNVVYRIPERMAEGAQNSFIRAVLMREARLTASYEVAACEQFDQVVWVTREDSAAFHQLLVTANQKNKITLRRLSAKGDTTASKTLHSMIPICLDRQDIRPVDRLTEQPAILFLGGMHWPPNLQGVRWFIQNVFPVLQVQIPDVHLYVVGKSPPTNLVSIPGVEFTGYQENAQPYWEQSRVFIVPLLAGGGMRVKILDAWAHGIPVVATSIGAEGINYHNRDDILIADSPEDFAASLSEIIKDARFAERISKNGRNQLERLYEWKSCYKAWDYIYTAGESGNK